MCVFACQLVNMWMSPQFLYNEVDRFDGVYLTFEKGGGGVGGIADEDSETLRKL